MSEPVADCVVGYHTNPYTCGVAKFNELLGQQLGVPVVGLFDEALAGMVAPLLSIKVAEFSAADRERLEQRGPRASFGPGYRLFLHDYTSTSLDEQLVDQAAVVYVGNVELADRLRGRRPDVVTLFCPGTLDLTPQLEVPETTVFTFGMAHKVRASSYRRLNELLAATERSYALLVSTALHEDTSFDGSFFESFHEIREVFEGPVHFLGFLSDAAVATYLREATYFAAFFERGCRANNTSVNAAMEAGAVVVTNLDDYSPPSLRHGETVLDVNRTVSLPDDAERLALSKSATAAADELGWPALMRALAFEGAPPARS